MDNSLKTKANHKKTGTNTPQKRQNQNFLIGKRLKTTDLRQTAAERGTGTTTKPNPKPRIASAKGKSSRWRGSYAALQPCG